MSCLGWSRFVPTFRSFSKLRQCDAVIVSTAQSDGNSSPHKSDFQQLQWGGPERRHSSPRSHHKSQKCRNFPDESAATPKTAVYHVDGTCVCGHLRLWLETVCLVLRPVRDPLSDTSAERIAPILHCAFGCVSIIVDRSCEELSRKYCTSRGRSEFCQTRLAGSGCQDRGCIMIVWHILEHQVDVLRSPRSKRLKSQMLGLL